MMTRGLFITMEGGDGAGKTTHIDFLKGYLEDAGMEVIVTREPGGTRLGESLRSLLLDGGEALPMSADTELMLVFASRMQHLDQIILPALDAGKMVLCDRFTDATYAYQGGGRGIDDKRIETLEEWVQKGLQPDLTLLLDTSVETGLARTESRGGQSDRFESRDPKFKEAVRRAYRFRAERFPGRIKTVDANRGIEDVQTDLKILMDELLAAAGRS